MNGNQRILYNYAKYTPKLIFPKNFKIKFKFIDGMQLDDNNLFPFLNKDFGYQAHKGNYIIKPSYNEFGDTYWINFIRNFENSIDFAYVDYLSIDSEEYNDYDAFYSCIRIS